VEGFAMAILAYCPKCGIYRSRKNTAIIKGKKRAVCLTCRTNLDKSRKFRINVCTPEGKRITEVIEGTLTFARTVEAKKKTDVAKKKHFNLHKAPLLNDIGEKYLKWARENKKDWRHDEGRWNLHVKQVIGNKKMDQVTPMDVTNLLSKMKKYKAGFIKSEEATVNHKVEEIPGKPADATRKHVLVLIKRVYNWAIKNGLYHGMNPATKVEAPKVNNLITECLTSDELSRLIVVLDNWENRLGAFVIKFALHTGFRLGEIIGLKWKDIDLERWFIYLEDPKGNPVKLPICNEAIEILVEVGKMKPSPDCDWVFPNNKGRRRVSMGKIWYRIRKAAKISKDFRFHGLRHTFSSYLVSSGDVDIYTLQKLLNHSTPSMTQRYAHLQDEALRRGANVADRVFNLNCKKEKIENT
jgi:integrase